MEDFEGGILDWGLYFRFLGGTGIFHGCILGFTFFWERWIFWDLESNSMDDDM
jgi:hypothetical protein